MQLVLGRASVTSVLVAGLMLFKDKTAFKVKLKDLWLFILAGLFSIVLFNYSYYTTMSLASLSVAAVLLYTAPFFVVIISRFVFSSKFTLNKITALFIAFIGCCFVSGLFDSSQRISSKALFFGLLTGFGYALYTIFGELLLKRGYSTLTITFYVFLSAFICSLPLTDWKSVVNAVAQKPISLVVIFLMAFFNTVIPYILYTNGLKGVDPSVAPIIATLEPVVATVIGAVIFKEKITFFGALGIILVLVSVVILNMKKINVTANAKINLILSITGKREDGYHFIDTVMQSVSLSDRVSVKPSKAIKVN
jgi:drug/metabolite transporter (DMT)-like permease